MTFRQKSLADPNPQYSHYEEDNGPDLQVRSIFKFAKQTLLLVPATRRFSFSVFAQQTVTLFLQKERYPL